MRKPIFALAGVGAAAFALAAFATASPIQQQRPRGASAPPKDAIVLFSGKAEEIASNWTVAGSDAPGNWEVADGNAVTTKNNIATKQKFMDFRLHVEWQEPDLPEAKGQEKGNSGVFLQGRYEIQILDSFGIADPGKGDCGAVYNQAAPLVNACRPALQWQRYDIIFRSARLDDTGKVSEPAHVTVLQNGICVQNNTAILHATGGEMDRKDGTAGPIVLQFHGNRLMFRNVWIVPLPEHGATHY